MRVLEHDAHERVTGLMPSGEFLFLIGHGQTAALTTPTHLVACLFQLAHGDGLLVRTRGRKRRLIEQVGQFGAGIAGRAASDHREIDTRIEFHVFRMNFENGLAAPHVGQIDRDLAVETARAQQRRIKHVRPVCGGDNDNSFRRIKTVHLDEQRIERLFAFVIATAQAMAAAAADRINLIDKNQARCILPRLLEHVANTASPDAHKHLNEV